jgi:hypothetical protein
MKPKLLLLLAFVLVLTTQGFECINEDLLVSIDIKGITGKYKVNPGDGTFNDSTKVRSNDYLDPGYPDIKNVRIYDIKVSTSGSYTGTINIAEVTVRDSTAGTGDTGILSVVPNTDWGYFKDTPRSLLTDPKIQKNTAGILALVNAIKQKHTIVLRGDGRITPGPTSFQTDVFIKVEVYGQVDANP